MLSWQMSAIKPGRSSGRCFWEKLAKSAQGTGLHSNRKLECISWEGNRAEKALQKLPKRKFDNFLMQKIVKTTRREVGLNLSLACREELFENVISESKNRVRK